MSWGRNRRRGSPDIASLIESVQALHNTDDFLDPIEQIDVAAPEVVVSGPTSTVAPRTRLSVRSQVIDVTLVYF